MPEEDQLLQPNTYSPCQLNPLVLAAEHIYSLVGADPDTMTLDEALKQPDKEEFLKAMKKELLDHINRKHWKVIPLKVVPKGKRCLPMVWSMKRKRNPIGEITKWKARLCAGGHRSIEFVDYWSTYSPVIAWPTARLIFLIALINNWHIRSVDFVLAYPQAKLNTDIYMKPPRVPHNFLIPDLPTLSDRFTKVYQLLRNLYGLKDAGKTWNDYLHAGLIKRKWVQSEIDPCLYYKEDMMLIVYVDDTCFISPDSNKITKEIQSLKETYDLTDEGELKDYLGVRFKRNKNSITLTMPSMIERVLKIVKLDPGQTRVKTHDTPATSVLTDDNNSKPREQDFDYRSAVGCLEYIQAIVRPDITTATQQCARFCNSPKKQHEEAVKHICRYLLKTKDKGLIYTPDISRGLECYVDADWAGSWTHNSSHDPKSCHSRTGFCIMYAGCPIIWKSSMQQIIALSTTEAEYIALSSALREVIGTIHLLEEMKKFNFKVHTGTPKITCKTFEDNASCLKIATEHKTRARTKHLSIRLHHFRSHILNKTITIDHVSSKNQLADILTKPLPRVQFERLRNILMGWLDAPS